MILIRRFIVSLCFITLSPYCLANATQDATEFVQQTLDRLLTRVTLEKDRVRDNPAIVYSAVNEILAPYFDTNRIARGVMSRYYRKASKEQKIRFRDKFERSLMQQYAAALSAYDATDQRIEVLPGTKSFMDRKKVLVKLRVVSNSGTIPMTYSLVRQKKGGWKIKNVIINGINLGLTLRNQFKQLMLVNAGDLDQTINSWGTAGNVAATD